MASRPGRRGRPRLRGRPRRLALFGVLLAVLALVGACGSSAPNASAGPTISGAWVRPPLGPDRPAAGYLTITGSAAGADALLGASSTAAAMVELHETSAGASGMAAMHPVHRLEIPAGGTVRLEPGGYHLMLMNPASPLEPGGTVTITLRFETAGEMTVTAEIRQGT